MVRRRLWAVTVALALATSPSFSSGTASAATPRLPAPPPSGSGAPALLALPGGIVWDYDGSQILRSTDAGATWRAVLPTWPLTQISLQVTGAFFLNANDAWAETQHEWPAQPGATTTWQTTDGGATWHQGISLPGAPQYGTAGFDEFAFADAEHGFGFGVAGASTSAFEQERQGSLWATSDGGRHWGEVAGTGLPWEGSTLLGHISQGLRRGRPVQPDSRVGKRGAPRGSWLPGGTARALAERRRGPRWAPVHLPVPPGGWASAEAWHYPGVGESGAEVLALRFFAGGQGVAAVTTRPGQLVGLPLVRRRGVLVARPGAGDGFTGPAGRFLGVVSLGVGAAGAGGPLCDHRCRRPLGSRAFGPQPPRHDRGELRVPGKRRRFRELPRSGAGEHRRRRYADQRRREVVGGRTVLGAGVPRQFQRGGPLRHRRLRQRRGRLGGRRRRGGRHNRRWVGLDGPARHQRAGRGAFVLRRHPRLGAHARRAFRHLRRGRALVRRGRARPRGVQLRPARERELRHRRYL